MKIIWTQLALADVQHVWNYVSQDNPDAADNIVHRIDQAVEGLISYKNMGRPGRVKGTRELVILGTPYIVSYRTKNDFIEILAGIHGARRWPQSFSV